MAELNGRVVVITGANGGLGTWVTKAFLREGAMVVGVARSISASDFEHRNFDPKSVQLSTREEAQAVIDNVTAKYQRIDALIHLIGGYAGGDSVADTTDDLLNQMFDVNLRSALNTFAAVIPVMRTAGRGRIIAVGSRAAMEPSPSSGAYAASKAALVSLIRTIAAENSDRSVTANIVLPGTMDTPANRTAMPQADFSKWVQPGRVAELMIYLASDAGADVNGAAIPVYGGDT